MHLAHRKTYIFYYVSVIDFLVSFFYTTQVYIFFDLLMKYKYIHIYIYIYMQLQSSSKIDGKSENTALSHSRLLLRPLEDLVYIIAS